MLAHQVSEPVFKDLHEEYGPSLDTIRKWVQAATIVAIDTHGVAVTKEQSNNSKKSVERQYFYWRFDAFLGSASTGVEE